MTTPLHPAWLIVVAGIVALIPTAVALFTSYAKVSIVLGMIRTALGTQQVPSGLVVMAMSLAISIYTMAPVIDESVSQAANIPDSVLRDSTLASNPAAFAPVLLPFRRFLEEHAGDRETVFLTMLDEQRSGEPAPPLPLAVPLKILMPAFVLTELKEGFAMALMLLLPFLVIDIVVANILVGLGMVMVQPATVALPLKLVLFVLADGWLLVTKGLILSYGGVPT